ncbi:glutathionylspermidine synthase family protein [Actinocorallia sp. A-T 12471]|uniref:glutathionylspermidine synthase family protein n=1 Tax=Actinocorallia sp. A-T 12471 TaxID=3089813 RepID=UPI0029CF9E07|nr:glutathionylspermidine synthase family protein [Actinocorallia sp. A-T 12471]MDX6743453.1 glutathionylspermidine synthase family protein [Actinocorallia sp. A-T 12471]
MRRERSRPRDGWAETIESQGLAYHRTAHPENLTRPYWDESVHYVLEMDEVLRLEEDVETLHRMCLEAAEHVVKTGRYELLRIDERYAPAIEQSWRRADPHLYGRFDLRYDGTGPAKLLEYNADTPTSLVESSIIQWYWKEEVFPADDQWNSLHERLVDRWREMPLRPGPVHFAWTEMDESGEELMTIAYLQETAEQAGRQGVPISMQEVGWDGEYYRDMSNAEIKTLCKLYPWEWIVAEPFGAHVDEADWVEPMWKMLLSNKGLLVLLWELFPGHPNLLPAYLDGPRDMSSHIRKPLLGREGASMTVTTPSFRTETLGGYGAEGFVFQEFVPLPDFDGQHPVLGAWMVADESAGLGIRETSGLITDDTSSFIPHRIPL